MRGDDQRTGSLFAYVNIAERIRPNHPLRPIKALVDAVLDSLSLEPLDLFQESRPLAGRRHRGTVSLGGTRDRDTPRGCVTSAMV